MHRRRSEDERKTETRCHPRLHTYDFQIPREQQVPQIAEQNSSMFARSAAVLDSALAEADYAG